MNNNHYCNDGCCGNVYNGRANKQGYWTWKKETFANTWMIIINEISFCTTTQLGQLDQKLKIVKKEPNLMFGGMHVLFCGDFHQFPPIGGPSVRTCRFLEDPEWGEILGCIRMSSETEQDLEVIKMRVIIDNGLEVPVDSNYACHSSNRERNSIHAGVFIKHLEATHQKNLVIQPPDHTIIINADLQWTSTGNPIREGMAKLIYESCGDNYCNHGQNKKIDPYL
eukprot:scaffold12016_cov65-Attheya_sp.AAC.9